MCVRERERESVNMEVQLNEYQHDIPIQNVSVTFHHLRLLRLLWWGLLGYQNQSPPVEQNQVQTTFVVLFACLFVFQERKGRVVSWHGWSQAVLRRRRWSLCAFFFLDFLSCTCFSYLFSRWSTKQVPF